MSLSMRGLLAAILALSIAGCATAPPPAPPDYAVPRKPLDPKTQLETGRRY